jgi:hypothetical protein
MSEERLTTLGGTRLRHRVRRVASLLFLAVGWVAIVATSPALPRTTLSTELHFSNGALEGGEVELIAAVNAEAASAQPFEPLKVDLSMLIPKGAVDLGRGPSVSLMLPTGAALPLKPGPPQDDLETFELPWTPEACLEACIRSARLIVEDASELPTHALWVMSATIRYQEEDEVPENAGLALGIRPVDGADLLTSNAPPGDLLPTRGILLTSAQPQAHQTLELEIPRSAIPSDHVAGSGEASLVWRGGALRILAASSDTAAHVIIKSKGANQVDIPVSGHIDLVQGIAGVSFEMPFVATCGPDVCLTHIEVDFELVEGPWLVLDWSNNTPGIRTAEGDIWVQGPWHLRPVEA